MTARARGDRVALLVALALGARRRGARRRAAEPGARAAAPAATSGNANIVEKLLDEWRFREGPRRCTSWCAPRRRRRRRCCLEGYAAFLEGDYDGAVRKLDTAVEEAGSAEPTAAAASRSCRGWPARRATR